MLMSILVLAVIGFAVYSVVAHYKNTDSTQSVPKRVWASVWAAGAAIGAWVMAWFQS